MLRKGSSIFLVAHSQYRGVYMGVARRLVEEHEARIHLYTATEQESAYYRRNYSDICATITTANALYKACREPVVDIQAVVAEARRNETELGVTINELAVSDRHLGRGFALGGFGHPRSRISEETSYPQMLNAYNAEIAFWRGEIEEKKPVLALSAGKVLCVLARGRSIPLRILASSRYRNFYYWAVNEYFENPAFEAACAGAQPTSDLALEAPYDAHVRFRAQFRRNASFWHTVLSLTRMVLQHVYWRVHGYEKVRGYYLSENMRYVWRKYRHIVAMTDDGMADLAEVAGTPFVFFPLATEPETALQALSPEYLYQLSAIASVARDLPAGAVLAVKEHYAAAGRRPRDFYRQVSEFKNVRMLNMSEFGMEVARAAAAVVTISGTSGFEGAVMGYPVISFGRHNIYNFLPHVMVVTDEVQLKGYLQRALSGGFDLEKAKRDGQRFLQAVIDESFDLGRFAPIEPEVVDADAVAAAYHALRSDLAAAIRDVSALADLVQRR